MKSYEREIIKALKVYSRCYGLVFSKDPKNLRVVLSDAYRRKLVTPSEFDKINQFINDKKPPV